MPQRAQADGAEAAVKLRSPIVAILQHLRNRPSRTWSIVVTVFGDAVAPRGGSLWLGSLLSIFEAMEIPGGVVRTAMSRLAADGWLQRSRVGRNSFYRLTDTGRASFAAAAERIYGEPPANWDGRFNLVLLDSGTDRDTVGGTDKHTVGGTDKHTVRGVLESSGFGSIAPGVLIAPLSTPVPHVAASLLRLQGSADVPTGRQLAERAWTLTGTAEAYRRFLHAFEPLWQWIATSGGLSDLDALVARILLVHEYRRVVLRDPLLPPALLPTDWPGTAARGLASRIYQALLPGSERWLEQNGQNEDGLLPPPSSDLQRRFGTGVSKLKAPANKRVRVTEFS